MLDLSVAFLFCGFLDFQEFFMTFPEFSIPVESYFKSEVIFQIFMTKIELDLIQEKLFLFAYYSFESFPVVC